MGMFDFLGDIATGITGYIAGEQQEKAQKRALKTYQKYSDQALGYQEPYRVVGTDALNSLRNALGLGNTDAAMSQFQNSPLYKLLYGDALKEGADDVMSIASSRGQLNNGATLKALQDNRVKTANKFFSDYIAGLDNLATRGQNAANAAGNIAVGAGSQLSGIQSDMGATRAAQTLGIGNSISSGIQNIGEMIGGFMGGGGSSMYGSPNLGNVNRYTGMIGGGV
jgi:hypothetical protein